MGKVVRFSRLPRERASSRVVRPPSHPYNGTRVPTQVATTPQVGEPFLVGGWRVEPTLNRLVRGDVSVQLEHKAMDVLLCLVENAGEVVTKHELLDAVWQTEFVSDNTLQRRIAELRDALDDNALNPRYIETFRKRGYRLIAEIGAVDHQVDPTPLIPESPSTARDDPNPYPGLAAFTEANTEFFFGRERETASLWRTITSRRLLALIGPSGVGKSSLLRAGVASRPPPGWRAVVFTPGESPVLSLAQALAPDHAGDPAAVSKLVGFTDPDIVLAVVSRWRGRFDGAVLVVDQFEELFTLNPPEVQTSFIELLRRLVDAADVHIVLAMRDDFLCQCQQFPRIAPIFKELTPLGPPTPEALRRAITEPATRRLHRFESEVLVDRMVAEVENQRAALPLLAFAVHRLWEERDPEQRLLTEEAYDQIGGVSGALALHAENVMGEIGHERLAIVRDIFRNLVTAEGTRAVREIDELLLVFNGTGRNGATPSPTNRTDRPTVGAGFIPARDAAREVLYKLIDARLLTTFETNDDEKLSTRRVEIVHESLLSAWPRLVRWQTQDADGVQFRDQLRRAARTWHDRGRADDLLWSASAYREYQVWRERFPGGLSETERAFGDAMTRYATRRRHRRRMAITTIFIALLVVLGALGVSWRRTASEMRQAEAAHLFALAQLHINAQYPYALAHAIASLELADNPAVRRLALDALWRGPTVLVIPSPSVSGLDFSSDGRWLATADHQGGGVLWPFNGDPPTRLEGSDIAWEIAVSPRGDLVAANTGDDRREIGIWSFPEGRFLRAFDLGPEGLTAAFSFSPDGERLFTSTQTPNKKETDLALDIRSWRVDGGDPDLLAHLDLPASASMTGNNINRNGTRLSWADGRRVHIAPLHGSSIDWSSQLTVRHDAVVAFQQIDPLGRRLLSSDTDGWVRIWSLEHDEPVLTHEFGGMGATRATSGVFDRSGSRVVCGGGFLWDLTAPADTKPLKLMAPVMGWGLAFHPSGDWLALGGWKSTVLWPLSKTYPLVLPGHEALVYRVAFTPDGSHLVSSSDDGSVRLWSLESGTGERSRELDKVEGAWASPWAMEMAPDGTFVVTGSRQGRIAVVPLGDMPVRELVAFTDVIGAVAVGPHSQLVAAGAGSYKPEEAFVRIWDLKTGRTQTIDSGDGRQVDRLKFDSAGDLWVVSGPTLRHWSLGEGQPTLLEEIDLAISDLDETKIRSIDTDHRNVVLSSTDRLWVQNLDSSETRELTAHSPADRFRIEADAEIVLSADPVGTLRVGPISGEPPHLLFGHQGRINEIALSPDGRWIATGGDDFTIRLWPMPDLTKPPLHTLPREELIAKLKTLTNLRVVRDSESSTGWALTHDPFPGWETVPSW